MNKSQLKSSYITITKQNFSKTAEVNLSQPQSKQHEHIAFKMDKLHYIAAIAKNMNTQLTTIKPSASKPRKQHA